MSTGLIGCVNTAAGSFQGWPIIYLMAQASTWNRDVNNISAILSVSVLGVVGSIVFLLLPMLIGAFTNGLSLDTRQVGLLGSADMIGMFIAAVVATLWIRRWNWRVVAVMSCALLITFHSLSGFVQSFAPLFLIRVAAGFAGGSLMSIALTSLGDTRKPDRYFALFIAGQLMLGALALWLFPGFLAQFGLRGVFTGLAIVVLAVSLFIPFIPQQGRVIETTSRPIPTGHVSAGADCRVMLPGVMALLACFAFNMGIMAVWVYLERLGNGAGLEPSFIGYALSLSLLAALCGALLAAALADRFGRVIPLLITIMIQLIALVLLTGDLTANTFLAGVILFSFAWNFPVAYQLAITVSMDVSGRLVVLFLSAVKLGYAAGAAVAALLIVQSEGFIPVMVLGLIGFISSAVIFVTLARTVHKT